MLADMADDRRRVQNGYGFVFSGLIVCLVPRLMDQPGGAVITACTTVGGLSMIVGAYMVRFRPLS